MHMWELGHVHRQRLEGKWVHTWATSHHALSIERVSVHNLGIISCMSESRTNQSCMIIKSNNQSINHKVAHVGPPLKSVYFAWLNVTDSIILELWKIYSCLLKSRGAEDRLKTRAELKLFERKLDFWNLFEKLESRRLFKNWNFKVYLNIRLLETKCENENF